MREGRERRKGKGKELVSMSLIPFRTKVKVSQGNFWEPNLEYFETVFLTLVTIIMILGRRESLEDDLRRERERERRKKRKRERKKKKEGKREMAKVGDREKVRERK